ncbi:MAG: tyrosine-type recombinase/integrase [Acidobacteria bacterium]|nr:tyrosine-type recombinase/integrase [Acidobacteriota bacterium]
MGIFKRKDSKHWWYRFEWHGKEISKSTKQGNRRVAEQMEQVHRAKLAMGEVGIREAKKAPTLKEFADGRFGEFIRVQFAGQPGNLAYYQSGLRALLEVGEMANARIDSIRQDAITAAISKWTDSGYEVSTINRRLQVLRRMFKLATEWEIVEKSLATVRMVPGENKRDRVLSVEEERAYFEGATAVGEELLRDYERALKGIRATKRGEAPTAPADPYLLRDVSTMLLECALRPEECFRLRWDEIHDGAIRVAHGKTANARRVVPLPERASAVVEMRRAGAADGAEWVFPAATKAGHIDSSTVRKQHAKACALAEMDHFPLYTFRHTCLTNWARVMDPYVLAKLAGHADFATTRRYVHPQVDQVLDAMAKAAEARGRYDSRNSDVPAVNPGPVEKSVIH